MGFKLNVKYFNLQKPFMYFTRYVKGMSTISTTQEHSKIDSLPSECGILASRMRVTPRYTWTPITKHRTALPPD